MAEAPTSSEVPASVERVRLNFEALPEIQQRSSIGAEWWLALRHLGSKKSETMLSVVTGLSIIGVVVAVAAFNIVLAVMTGFEQDLRDKILGANAHVVVLGITGAVRDHEELTAKIEGVEGVDAASSFVYTEMMIRSPSKSTGVVLKGIDPDRTGLVTSLREDLVTGIGYEGELTPEQQAAIFDGMKGTFPALSNNPDKLVDQLPGIFIGRELADMLHSSAGNRVQIVDPIGGGPGVMGMPTPRVKNFVVAGVFDSGMYEYDTKWTYLNNAEAQKFLRLGDAVTGLEVRVSDIDNADHIARSIDEVTGPGYYTRHWMEMNEELFKALRLEKLVMGLLLTLYVILAALLIVTTLVMLVITKGREIAILKAMGASSVGVMRIFVMEGSIIGFFGTIIGSVLGLAGCYFLKWYGYPLSTDVYYLDTLPVVIDRPTVAVIAVLAFVICVTATLYPAWRAASLDPVEGLRYE